MDKIGTFYSCFDGKFGVPRQPGLVREARGVLRLEGEYARGEALRGLEAFSHAWVLFLFDRVPAGEWSPTVRPPRLGGDARVGVFASRSPFRPNGIGMSVMKMVRVDVEACEVEFEGVDLVDGTTVVDLKPYVPYADCVEGAGEGFAGEPVGGLAEVVFGEGVEEVLGGLREGFRELVRGVLLADPRPAVRRGEDGERVFGMRVEGVEVRWRVEGERVVVEEILEGL